MQFVHGIDSCLGISQPRMFLLDYSEIEIFNFKSMLAKSSYDVDFDDWSNHCSSWNRFSFLFLRKTKLSPHK